VKNKKLSGTISTRWSHISTLFIKKLILVILRMKWNTESTTSIDSSKRIRKIENNSNKWRKELMMQLSCQPSLNGWQLSSLMHNNRPNGLLKVTTKNMHGDKSKLKKKNGNKWFKKNKMLLTRCGTM